MRQKLKGQLYLYIGILVSIIVALSALYTVYLINRSGIADDDDDGKADFDFYQLKLEQDLGVGGSNYENRELYTDEQFDSDRRNLIKEIQNNRFDTIAQMANTTLAKYKFDNDNLATWIALERAEIFAEDTNATSDQKTALVAQIQDPILYMYFFLRLTFEEQRALIKYNNVNIIPAFQYDSISMEAITISAADRLYPIIRSGSCYKLTLSFAGHDHYVYMIKQNGCQIFYVTNENDSMHTTYN